MVTSQSGGHVRLQRFSHAGLVGLLGIGLSTLVLAGPAAAQAAAGGSGTHTASSARATYAPDSATATTPMTRVRVTRLVTTTPDKAGLLRVQLANGRIVAIPASTKDLVMRRAAQEATIGPDNVVQGNCGSSYVHVQYKANDQPVRMTTGFEVITAAVGYVWQVSITGPSYQYAYSAAGDLAFDTTWDGSHDSGADYPAGTYAAAVNPDESAAVLWTGDLCWSGGPTDSKYMLPLPDTSTSSPLTTPAGVTRSSHSSRVVRPTVGTSLATSGWSPSYPGTLGGAAAPQSIIGTDTRTQVTDTTAYPYRAVTLLIVTYPNGQTFGCSGFLYTTSVVATAGHCIYAPEDGGWATSVEVVPGANGSNNYPYGTCYGTTAYSVDGWVGAADTWFDYGAVKLNCTIGDTVGWFGLRWQSNSWAGQSVTVTGYPSDKPLDTMWTASGDIAGVALRVSCGPVWERVSAPLDDLWGRDRE
jgi:V8-like Glu-specific endopeptidase